MARYEVEVIGHFSEVIEIEADSYEEAEELALQDFERENSPYSARHGWTDAWSHTEVEASRNLDEEEY